MTTATDELRELRDDELDAVTGGLVVIAIIAILFGPLLPQPNPSELLAAPLGAGSYRFRPARRDQRRAPARLRRSR